MYKTAFKLKEALTIIFQGREVNIFFENKLGWLSLRQMSDGKLEKGYF